MRLVPLASLLLMPLAVPADIIWEGHHSVATRTCFEVVPKPGFRAVEWLHFSYSTGTVLSSGDCPDQGYKFGSANLFWVPETRATGLADSLAHGTIDDLDQDKSLLPIAVISSGGLMGNGLQVPDSIPLRSVNYTYTIRGLEAALTKVEETYQEPGKDPKVSLSMLDYNWAGTHRRMESITTSPVPSLLRLDGARVLLRLPEGSGRLRLMDLQGRIQKQIMVPPTGVHAGWVDLGMVPAPGTFLELSSQGRHSMLRVVGSR